MQGLGLVRYVDRPMSLVRIRLNPENLCGAIDLSHTWGLTAACYAEAAVGGWGVMRSAETHVDLTVFLRL